MQLASKSNLPSRVPVMLLPLRIMRRMIPLIPSPGHGVSIGAIFVADLWLLGMLPFGALPTSNVFPSPGVRVVAPKWISDRLRRNLPYKLIIPKGLISVTFAGKGTFLMAWTLVSTGWKPFSTRWPRHSSDGFNNGHFLSESQARIREMFQHCLQVTQMTLIGWNSNENVV